MGLLPAAIAFVVLLASMGVFFYRQDLCVVAVSQGYTVIVRCMFLIGSCSHVHPGTTTTLLMTAVQYGHHRTAKFLLDSGADVDATDKAGRTALHHAARDDTSLVELLVQAGADVQAPDRDGFTPLMTAALHGRQAVVERLLASGADVNALSRFRDSALSLSVVKGHGGIVTLQLECNADVNIHDDKGQTLLVNAIAGGHLQVAALLLAQWDILIHNVADLLEKGQSTKEDRYTQVVTNKLEEILCDDFSEKSSSQNKSDNVTFLEACRQGRESDVESFLSTGKDVTEKDAHGKDCLMLGAENGHLDVVMLTMMNGWDVNARTLDKHTPLMLASSSGQVKVVEFLSRLVDLNQTDSLGRTALSLAALSGHDNIVVHLMKKGANPCPLDVHGNSPSHLAADEGHTEVLQVLLEESASVINAQNSIQRTPLMLAVERGHVETSNFLITSDANINIRDHFKQTALHMAVSRGDVSTVSLLLSKGAEVDAADSAGVTPLMMAARFGHLDASMSLVEAGAAVSGRNLQMKTPLILASENGYHAIVSFLLTQGANPQLRDREGNYALTLAAFRGDVGTLRSLIDNHADKEVKDGRSRTALFLAASGGHLSAVVFLLDKGAHVDSLDKGQRTPVMAAATAGFVEVVQVLVESGANVHVTDCDGNTALTLAQVGCHTEVTIRLSQAGAQLYQSLFAGLFGLWRTLTYYPIVPITFIFLVAFGLQDSFIAIPKQNFVLYLAIIVTVAGRSAYVNEHFPVRFSSLTWLNDSWLTLIGTIVYSLALIFVDVYYVFAVLRAYDLSCWMPPLSDELWACEVYFEHAAILRSRQRNGSPNVIGARSHGNRSSVFYRGAEAVVNNLKKRSSSAKYIVYMYIIVVISLATFLEIFR